MNTNNSNKTSIRRVAGAVLCGLALTAAIGSSASAATPIHEAASKPPSAEGAMSISEVITNKTDQVWTFDSGDSGHSGPGAHWGKRPVQELDPGQSETVTAYSSEALGINLYVAYKLPNGEYVVADDVDAAIGSNGYNAAGVYSTLPDPQLGPTSKADPSYVAQASAGSGWHIDSTFILSNAASS